MNILLFAPGFLLVLLKHQGVYETIGHLAECGIIQVIAFSSDVIVANTFLKSTFR